MAQANKTTRTTGTKRKAPAAAPVNNGVAPTKQATGSKAAQAATPQAQLYTLGPWPAQQRGHRAYAQGIAAALTKAHPKGFTLAQFKAALVAGAATSTLAPPKGGWQGHNMPTWVANPNQGWLVPVAK